MFEEIGAAEQKKRVVIIPYSINRDMGTCTVRRAKIGAMVYIKHAKLARSKHGSPRKGI